LLVAEVVVVLLGVEMTRVVMGRVVVDEVEVEVVEVEFATLDLDDVVLMLEVRVVVETPAVDGKLTEEDEGLLMIGKGEIDV